MKNSIEVICIIFLGISFSLIDFRALKTEFKFTIDFSYVRSSSISDKLSFSLWNRIEFTSFARKKPFFVKINKFCTHIFVFYLPDFKDESDEMLKASSFKMEFIH